MARRGEIIAALRGRILSGEFEPGTRLPTRRELGTEFRASPLTIQHALDRLTSHGFVESRGRHGTFVSAHPPHLSSYAIIFPNVPDAGGRRRFWSHLLHEAVNVRRSRPCRIAFYFGLDGQADNPDYQKLLREVRSGRVAGVIFMEPPENFRDSPLLDEPGLGRVAIMPAHHMAAYPGVAAVDINWEMFVAKGLDYLRGLGRSRIAALFASGDGPPAPGELELIGQLRSAGLEANPSWMFGIAVPAGAGWARRWAALLASTPAASRPDGLIVGDDRLLDAALAGVTDAGVAVGRELDVAVHGELSDPAPLGMPLRRIGFDTQQVLDACLGEIDRQRREKAPPVLVLVPTIADHERVAAPVRGPRVARAPHPENIVLVPRAHGQAPDISSRTTND